MNNNKLREIRESRNVSQNKLARLTNISQPQISRYEKDQQLTEDSIRKICDALECKADYLLGLIDDENHIRFSSAEYSSISFKDYYIQWYKEFSAEQNEISTEYKILNDVVQRKSFLHSNNRSENEYMISVLSRDLNVNRGFSNSIFDDRWKHYEELVKFPFVIKESNCSNGLFTFKISPKIDLYYIELYVKIKVDSDVFLFDACMENSTKFHAKSDYMSHFWVITSFDKYNFDITLLENFDRQIGIEYEFITKEEYEKTYGMRMDRI